MSKTLDRPQITAFLTERRQRSSLQERSDALSWVGAACQQAEQGGNALVRAYQLVETLLRNHVVSSAIPPDAAAQLGLGRYTGSGEHSQHDTQPTEVVLSASVTEEVDGTPVLLPAGVEVPFAPGLVVTQTSGVVPEMQPDGGAGGQDAILLKAHRHDCGKGPLAGGEGRGGGSRPMLTLSQTDEAASLYLEAFEHASRAAVLYAQACDTILQLTRRGFLMRPAQLEDADIAVSEPGTVAAAAAVGAFLVGGPARSAPRQPGTFDPAAPLAPQLSSAVPGPGERAPPMHRLFLQPFPTWPVQKIQRVLVEAPDCAVSGNWSNDTCQAVANMC